MLKVLSTLARVAFGFALASIAAGLVTVLFVNTPADVFAQPTSRLPETASETLDLALLTATHASIFSAAFVLIMAGLGEWLSIRALPFYLIAGMTIAALGFVAQYSSEVAGQPTILNNYAIKAFLTAGFFAGFVYWLAAGQFAGIAPEDPGDADRSVAVADEPAEHAATEDDEKSDDGTSIVINRPEAEAPPRRRYGSLLSRLKIAKRQDVPPETETESEARADVEPNPIRDDDESVIVRRPATMPEKAPEKSQEKGEQSDDAPSGPDQQSDVKA